VLDECEYVPGSIFDLPPAPDADLLQRAAKLGVSAVSAAMGGPMARQRLIDGHGLARIAGEGAIAGPALTIWEPMGSVKMNLPALELARPGDVIVISADRDTAQWGEVASTLASALGVVGAVVDGVVRDIDRIREMGFSTWGARIFASQGFRGASGLVNVPVNLQGLLIRPGDVVLADGDGIFAIPPKLLQRAVEAGERKHEVEERILASVSKGIIPDEMRKPFEITPEEGDLYQGAPRRMRMLASEYQQAR
jgi:4-hydroxy-4-methyl-2-oxoglutarate aldolase